MRIACKIDDKAFFAHLALHYCCPDYEAVIKAIAACNAAFLAFFSASFLAASAASITACFASSSCTLICTLKHSSSMCNAQLSPE